MESLQLYTSNFSDQSCRPSRSLSGVGHFHLTSREFIYVCGNFHRTRHQVAQLYPTETSEFPSHLSSLLLESFGSLSPDIRHSLVQNLVMLKNKGVITSFE
jgi:hypothetical protein